MKIAYIDCFSGISGDMFLGALIDAGVSSAIFDETVAALNVGARLSVSRTDRSGIAATKVDVLVNEEVDRPRVEHEHYVPHRHGHTHEHAHGPLPVSITEWMTTPASRALRSAPMKPCSVRACKGLRSKQNLKSAQL